MFSIFVVLSVCFERIGSWIGLSERLGRLERSPAYGRFERAFFAVPFVVYPIALVALSLAFSLLVDRAHAAESRTGIASGLPYDFLYLRDPLWSGPYHRIASLLLADVSAQSVVLAAVFAYARARALTRGDLVVVFAASVALVAAALGRPLLQSTDLYNYIVYARAGMAGAYGSAIAIDDAGLRHVAALSWGTSLPPSPYGPLWQLYDRAIVGTSSVADAALRLRCFNAAVLFVLFGGLLAARVPQAGLLVLVLNPYLYEQFVTSAHNDLLPIAALALAAAWSPGRPWLPIVAAILAGLVKLPLLAVGVATLATIASARTRIVALALVLIAVAALSYALGGPAYLHALLVSERDRTTLRQIVIALAALAGVSLAFVARRTYWPGLVAIPAIRSFQYAWYLGWLVPLAFVRRSTASPIAVLFPVVGFMLTTDVFPTPAVVRVAIYAVLAACLAIAIARRASGDVTTATPLRAPAAAVARGT